MYLTTKSLGIFKRTFISAPSVQVLLSMYALESSIANHDIVHY
jgi:hypothetical protein